MRLNFGRVLAGLALVASVAGIWALRSPGHPAPGTPTPAAPTWAPACNSGPAAQARWGREPVQAPDLAYLTGHYADVRADADGDGRYDQLRLVVQVEVITPELYNVVARLADGDGTEVAWASTQRRLDAGVYGVEVCFDGRLLGREGAYQVSRVELRAGDEEDLADAADDVRALTWPVGAKEDR